ncbi:MAG: hypothetical protein AAF826_09200 [Pseudomonadota bacterium]
MSQRVSKIISVEVTPAGNGQAQVKVIGQVNTGGWVNPTLGDLCGTNANGYLRLEMIATPPAAGSMVTQAISRKIVEITMPTRGAPGITVESTSNSISAAF